MPVMDGYEAAKKIRASGHPMAMSIPIIATTANAFSMMSPLRWPPDECPCQQTTGYCTALQNSLRVDWQRGLNRIQTAHSFMHRVAGR